jgi:hypothetical protein
VCISLLTPINLFATQEYEDTHVIDSTEENDIETNTDAEEDNAEIIARSPDDVTKELETVAKPRDSVFDNALLAPVDRAWNRITDPLNNRLGLELGLAYTLLFQYATDAQGPQEAGGGIFDFMGLWSLVDRDGRYPGSLGFRVDFKHRIGNTAPSDLNESIGSLWDTADLFNVQSLALAQLWWEQHFIFEQLDVILRVGKLDQYDFIGLYSYMSAKEAFLNQLFASNLAIDYPDNGLGLVSGLTYKRLYGLVSIGDANGDKSSMDMSTFFTEREYFTAFKFGYSPLLNDSNIGYYDISVWHSDDRESTGKPGGYGITLAMEQDIGTFVPFINYGYANGDATMLQQFLTVGTGVESPFNYADGLIGMAFGWGNPANSSLRDQYAIETFYRLPLTPIFTVTPDIQLIIHPSEAPSTDLIGVFGLRLRMLL